jgi:hypothetical protein
VSDTLSIFICTSLFSSELPTNHSHRARPTQDPQTRPSGDFHGLGTIHSDEMTMTDFSGCPSRQALYYPQVILTFTFVAPSDLSTLIDAGHQMSALTKKSKKEFERNFVERYSA